MGTDIIGGDRLTQNTIVSELAENPRWSPSVAKYNSKVIGL